MVPEATTNLGKITVILVAAGRGSRAGEGLPKQYRTLLGKPLIRRTVDALVAAMPGVAILPVIHPDDRALFSEATAGVGALSEPVAGGATRQESVYNALQALKEAAPDFVFVHDAARPFVSKDLIQRIEAGLDDGAAGVVPAIPIVDTLVRQREGRREPVDRTNLFAVQTPQAFTFKSLLEAHEKAVGAALTDDASVLEANDGVVTQVTGSDRNFKITRPEDFRKAEQMIESSLNETRMGSGYDVHRFEDGSSVWLCGIEIPFSKALKGHSDADVALHALTDAILAALADGDIGAHFPPSDDEWRGAPSDRFLGFACERVRARGGRINHLGVTIICEAPKIRPHVDAMRSRIAEIAGIDTGRVSVQATTTEKLGFTGREEGIAAQATATLALPSDEVAP